MWQAFERRGEGDFWPASVAAPDLQIRGEGGGGGGGWSDHPGPEIRRMPGIKKIF